MANNINLNIRSIKKNNILEPLLGKTERGNIAFTEG